jgi:hypothetical protein
MGIRRIWIFTAVLAVALLAAPPASFAALSGRIVEGVGVKTAKLGVKDSTDAKRIGGTYKRSKDTSYAGQTVWKYVFGKKSGGKYGLEMYSKGNHLVFTFVINSTRLRTKNGTHVGTTEDTLTSRYGSKLKKSVGPVYTQYYMGTRRGRTEFWVLNSKVHHIVISRY